MVSFLEKYLAGPIYDLSVPFFNQGKILSGGNTQVVVWGFLNLVFAL
jgi:hypothetical protein